MSLAKPGSRNKNVRRRAVPLITASFAVVVFALTALGPSASAANVAPAVFAPRSSHGNLVLPDDPTVDNNGVVRWINADLAVHKPYRNGCFAGPDLKPGEEWQMPVAFDVANWALRVDGKLCDSNSYRVETVSQETAPKSGIQESVPDKVTVTYTCKGHPHIWGRIIIEV